MIVFYCMMLESTFTVSEDGSANGCVHHRVLLNRPTSREYIRKVDAYGVCHEKHTDSYRLLPVPDGFAVAGQDVYGMTPKSIVVADGHGPNGTDMALRAVQIASAVEEIDIGCITRPRQVEASIRDVVKSFLVSAPETKSGATYVQMMFHQWRHKRWVITVNVGDSEALLVGANTVIQCSMPHNWDDKDVYHRYMQTCLSTPQPVCYNRWNASSRHTITGPNGSREPIMMYDTQGEPIWEHAEFVSHKLGRKGFPFGTQSVRMPTYSYENWGSCVCVNNKALGQLVASYGDQLERVKTGVSYDMIHIYIHELGANEEVTAIVQSDGVSNRKTIQQCALDAGYSAERYVQSITESRDDMSVVKCHWALQKKTPYPAM